MPERKPAAIGPNGPWSVLLAPSAGGAAAAHLIAVVAASALTPQSYPLSHAISELGTSGKPYAELTNVGGMIVPGLLIALSAIAAARSMPVDEPPLVGVAAMIGAGASLVVAGLVPFPAPLHLGAALAAAALCAIGLAFLAPWAAARLGRRLWATTGLACALFLVVDVIAWVLAEGLERPPHPYMGAEQRAASFAAFAWWGLCGIALGRRA